MKIEEMLEVKKYIGGLFKESLIDVMPEIAKLAVAPDDKNEERVLKSIIETELINTLQNVFYHSLLKQGIEKSKAVVAANEN
jgi:hypothetical protein